MKLPKLFNRPADDVVLARIQSDLVAAREAVDVADQEAEQAALRLEDSDGDATAAKAFKTAEAGRIAAVDRVRQLTAAQRAARSRADQNREAAEAEAQTIRQQERADRLAELLKATKRFDGLLVKLRAEASSLGATVQQLSGFTRSDPELKDAIAKLSLMLAPVVEFAIAGAPGSKRSFLAAELLANLSQYVPAK